MFKALIAADKLKESVEAISTFIDEAKLRFTDKGISVKAVDPANVAMVALNLSKSAFDSYEATEGEIGMDFIKLASILEMAAKEDTVELALNEEAHKLLIRMRDLSYTISLLDPSAIRKEPKIPTLDLPAKITLKGEDLHRAIKASEKVGDHISMGVNGEIFYMEAIGDVDSVRLELTKDQLIDLKSGEAKSMFSLEYLKDIGKVLGKANEITVNLGKDYPIKINFKIAEDKGEIEYMLAPRVESE